MEALSATHWVIIAVMFLAFVASPILGIVRGVKNGGVLHALMSFLFPVYGLVYFIAAAARRDRARDQPRLKSPHSQFRLASEDCGQPGH